MPAEFIGYAAASLTTINFPSGGEDPSQWRYTLDFYWHVCLVHGWGDVLVPLRADGCGWSCDDRQSDHVDPSGCCSTAQDRFQKILHLDDKRSFNRTMM